MILTENLLKIASKLTSIVIKLANIALAGEHIFQVLGQSILMRITTILTSIVTILASIEQVNTPLDSWRLMETFGPFRTFWAP